MLNRAKFSKLIGYGGVIALTATLACNNARTIRKAIPAAADAPPEKKHPAGEIIPIARTRDAKPVRLGMVALLGVGDSSAPLEPSAELGSKLGPEGEKWITEHCDVVALDSRCITPETYPRIRSASKLFTGLLFTYGSSLYEQPDHRGSVGVWKPSMASWELKTGTGTPVKHEDAGGHWMDCGNPHWQSYWGKQAQELAMKFHADGVVVSDLPPGNTFIGNDLLKYHSFTDKVDATSSFLAAVHKPSKYLIVPSAVGFDQLVGRSTLPVEHKRYEPRLAGRCWDEFDNLDDGSWAEGWVQLPWQPGVLNESDWEIQLEAADRAGRVGDVFICSLGYSTPDELEYGLASFLLVVHQGRAVIQPMPIYKGEPANAGMSLKVMMREYNKYRSYFDVLLGGALTERRYVHAGNGSVWRRIFSNGDVYVNSGDSRSVLIQLGGPMLTVTGQTVQSISLGPHSGAIFTRPVASKLAAKI